MDLLFEKPYSARHLNSSQRKDLALQMLSDTNVSQLAAGQHTSRKFLYTQKSKAVDAVNDTFSNITKTDDKVLFYIPVTKKYLKAMVLSLILHCRSTFGGIQLLFNDMLDRNISKGAIYNILIEAKIKAMEINESESLDGIKIGLQDELYHHDEPVLAGIDEYSLYCYLLNDEEKRDGDTWGINLLEAVEQGFNPKQIIADNGKGIEAGSQIACPNAVYSKDNFHITKDLLDTKRFFTNKLKSAEKYFLKQQTKMDKAKLKKQGRKVSSKYNAASKELNLYTHIYKTISILISWFRHDVIYKAGYDYSTRNKLYDFILEEFRKLAALHPHRIDEICKSLEYQKDGLLAFAARMEVQFQALADEYKCSLSDIWKTCELQRYSYENTKYHYTVSELYKVFGDKLYHLLEKVKFIMNSISASSSLVENFNSRLSGRFFIHRYIGNGYLDLLRFYLNHVPFLRSSREHRKGKTPAQLMMGKEHPHWLDLLGLAPFTRATA
ncbi:MAG: hypothetical protein HOK35_16465 [Cytophagia bacterium]|nr:hypothetical protein [Cytophagia bacterium]